MDNSRLTEALTWLGPLTPRELCRVLSVSRRTVQRYISESGYGYDEDGRVSMHVRHARRPRQCLLDVAQVVRGREQVVGPEVADRTGYERRAVYEALRDLGYTSRRGRGAMWTRGAMAAK